jgi:hypothetical protein
VDEGSMSLCDPDLLEDFLEVVRVNDEVVESHDVLLSV